MNSKYQISVALIVSALLTGCASEEKKHNEDSIQIPEPTAEKEESSAKSDELSIAERELDAAQKLLHQTCSVATIKIDALKTLYDDYDKDLKSYAAKEGNKRKVLRKLLSRNQSALKGMASVVEIVQDLVRQNISISKKQVALSLAYQQERQAFEQTPEGQRGQFFKTRWQSIRMLEVQQSRHAEMSRLLAGTFLMQANSHIEELAKLERFEVKLKEKLGK